MEPYGYEKQALDYERVAAAIRYIEQHFREKPTLDELAETVHMSKYHFDRIFKRWAGVSPMQFLKFLTLNYSKERLSRSAGILDASLDAGLSGPGRLHDLFVTFDAMTPGEFKAKGEGVNVEYGFGKTPFGNALLAVTERGICRFGFVEKNFQKETAANLKSVWPGAKFTENAEKCKSVIQNIFQRNNEEKRRPFNLHIKGTNFQINVWRALLTIPEGTVVSYKDVASYLGRPTAFRAAAGAIAVNPVAYLIPCHRVISSSGHVRQYRWGSARKKAMIGWEAAKTA